MDKVKKFLLMFVILFFCMSIYSVSTKVEASEWSELINKNVTEFDYNDGLTNNIGNAIAETSDGYIWIGQYAGLTKYNGKKFTTISSADDISLNGVLSLLADGNTLYIGTQYSFIKYENEKFEVIYLDSHINISINDIDIFDGTIYIASNKGAFAYKDGECSTISEENCIDIAASNLGVYYVTSENIVYSANTKTMFYNTKKVKSAYIYDNKLYLGTIKGEVIIYSQLQFKTVAISNITNVNTFLYASNILFIGTDNGLYTYDGVNVEKFDRLSISNSIEGVVYDYQGNLWIVSSSNGVCKITTNAFGDLFMKYGVTDYLYSKLHIQSTCVNAVTRYKNILYIATNNALIAIDEQTNQIVENKLVDMLLGYRIRALEIYQDKLYVGSYNSDIGIVVYDGEDTYRITSTMLSTYDDIQTTAGEIRCFAKNDESLYVGTNYGISKISNGSIKTIKPDYRPLYLYWSSDTLYACIQGYGIMEYNANLEFIQVLPGTSGITALKCLYNDDMLIYACGNTIHYVNNKEENKNVNLNVLGSIVSLDYINGKYYIGTDSEIYVVNESDLTKEEVKYRTLGRSDGLKSGLNSNASGMYDSNNEVYYFAGRDSLYLYNLNINAAATKQTKIAISSIFADDRSISKYSDVLLDADTKRFSVYFDILNYTDYNDYTVYYQLEDVDKGFNTASFDDLPSVSYTNLKGGNYTLHIYAVDVNGTKSENEIIIHISKEKQFYEQPVFIVAMSILGVLVIYAIVRVTVFIKMRNSLTRQNELKNITIESIEAIARTIDAKDKYTNGHSIRVGRYSKIIAEELNMNSNDVLNIYYIGLLHDIGKIAVDREIINKPGKLTDEEYAIMKKHTVEGARILSTISTIPHITEGAKYHHERYDGKGYPEGLIGENIPYIARIICCADCYDAMATKRSYKLPYNKDKIIGEFERCSGTQFDPNIAAVVITLIKNDKLNPNIKDDIINDDDLKNNVSNEKIVENISKLQ